MAEAGKLITIIVIAGNQEFRIPLNKGEQAIKDSICFMAEELTGYNAEFRQERLVKRNA